jgi:hypothetical protein
MSRSSALLVLALLTACGSEPPGSSPAAGQPAPDSTVLLAFRGVPFMFGAKFIGTTHSGDVAETKLLIDASPDSVANFYRVGLLRRGWSIANDARAADGGITILARSADRRSVWLMIARDSAGRGTILSVVGARPGADSTPHR